jgi:hypothetical protein
MVLRSDSSYDFAKYWNSTCKQKVMREHLPDLRHLCSELVSIVFASDKRSPRALSCNLEEIGERTAVVLSDAPIRGGSKVRIACKTHALKGVVKSCTFQDWLGFFVEVELDPDSRWSPAKFSPQHLFAPSEKNGVAPAAPPPKWMPLGIASGY